MRYSAVQEDNYGVGLEQEVLPNNVDESMMAATGELEPGCGGAVEEGSMISNLPLLFANGYPTSIEKLSLPELERFVTFMVQCSAGHDTTEKISEPQWWPKEIKFSIPLVRPKKINDNYASNLKKLVFRCYTYHRSEYLLRFCSYLAQYPHEKLEYINNWDSTTSLYLKTTGKLLVTFRNENMNYDKKTECSRKKLLSAKKLKEYPNLTKSLRRRSQRQAPSPAMVEPPSDDIYLCDTCDAEFIGFRQMQDHEKLCYPVEIRPPTPIDLEEKPELTQAQFMDYFNMTSKNSTNLEQTTDGDSGETSVSSAHSDPSQLRSSNRIRGSINLTRCPTIPFSSPAGLSLAKKSKMMTEIIQQERLDRIERHLHAPALSTSLKPKWFTKTYEFDRWSVTYKPNRDKTTQPDEYVHQYNFFNFHQKPMLDLRSQLLQVACKPIFVVIERLTEDELEELKQNPHRYRSPERQVPRFRPRSPSVESVHETQPDGDVEIRPIEIIDLDDEEPTPAPTRAPVAYFVTTPSPLPLPRTLPTASTQRPSPPPPPQPPPPRLQLGISQPVVSLPTLQKRPQAMVAAVGPLSPVVVNPVVSRASPLKLKTTLKRPKTPPVVYPKPKSSKKGIIFVDLCSSDEETSEPDEVSLYEFADENFDLIQKKQTTSLQNLPDMNLYISPSRFCGGKTLLFPADSTTWLEESHNHGYLDHSAAAFDEES